MRMDAQTTKKLHRARLALLRRNSKHFLSLLAEGDCWYRERFSGPLLAVTGKTGLHEAVTSERGCSNAHLKHSSLFSRTDRVVPREALRPTPRRLVTEQLSLSMVRRCDEKEEDHY